MSSLRHPNIIQFFGVCYFESPGPLPLLVMEQLEISLGDVLKYTPDLPLSFKRSVLEDVASGLLYLHTRNPHVIHGDLRVKNVLLTSSVAKITGFGISCTKEYFQRVANVAYGFSFDSRPSDIQSFGHLVNFTFTQVKIIMKMCSLSTCTLIHRYCMVIAFDHMYSLPVTATRTSGNWRQWLVTTTLL